MNTSSDQVLDSKLREGEEPPDGLRQEVISDESGMNLEALPAQVARLVEELHTFSVRAVECREQRAALQKAAQSLAELSESEEYVHQVVQGGAVDAVVPLLTLFAGHAPDAANPSGEYIEKEACLILDRLATCPDHQQAIADRGALPGLVGLFNRYLPITGPSITVASVLRHAADAISCLVSDNAGMKSRVGSEGGIPPLVALLDSSDPEVRRASAEALKLLAIKNEDNKNRIVECGALATLIQMLREDDIIDVGIHDEALGVLGFLAQFSPHMLKKVLDAGALQPLIGLLSRQCTDISRQQVAVLLYRFSSDLDLDVGGEIVRLGAVPHLIEMLRAADVTAKEMAALTLGFLAANVDNHAEIVQAGGLPLLVRLMSSRNGMLQSHAAFALFWLVKNKDNIDAVIREGGVQLLQDCEVLEQDTRK